MTLFRKLVLLVAVVLAYGIAQTTVKAESRIGFCTYASKIDPDLDDCVSDELGNEVWSSSGACVEALWCEAMHYACELWCDDILEDVEDEICFDPPGSSDCNYWCICTS